MKQLLEEAKRIAGAGSQPLYLSHLKAPSAKSTRSGKSPRSTKSSASARETSAEVSNSARKRGGPERRKSSVKGTGGGKFSLLVSVTVSVGRGF